MRLITRSDFDGLVCGTILYKLGIVDDYLFVHPKQLQDGEIKVTCNDALTNVPFVDGCGLWFDHHSSEFQRLSIDGRFTGASDPNTKSCARLVYEYYGGVARMPELELFVLAADKVDSADLTLDEVLNPSGWVLLGLICDPRTGLGRFKGFRISNYALMQKMMVLCGSGDLSEIMSDIDVKDRVHTYWEQQELHIEMLRRNSVLKDGVLVTDLRQQETIYVGNRFISYAEYPDTHYSVWIVRGKGEQGCSVAVGRSIFNTEMNVDIGELMLRYGGGGHHNVGTCQFKEMYDSWVYSIVDYLRNECKGGGFDD